MPLLFDIAGLLLRWVTVAEPAVQGLMAPRKQAWAGPGPVDLSPGAGRQDVQVPPRLPFRLLVVRR